MSLEAEKHNQAKLKEKVSILLLGARKLPLPNLGNLGKVLGLPKAWDGLKFG